MSLIAAASAWWNGHISAATIQAQLVAPINGFADTFADTGYISSGIVSAANSSTSITQKGRIIGNRAWLRISYNIGAAAVTAAGAPGATGALTATSVLNVIDSRFQSASSFASQGFTSGAAGRLNSHHIYPDDTIKLTTVNNGTAIVAGDTFYFFGDYLLD